MLMAKKQHKNQKGFGHIFILLIVLVLGGIGLASWYVFTHDKTNSSNAPATTSSNDASKGEPVQWAFNEKTLSWYTKAGKAPTCKDPFIFDRSPVDLSKIWAIGMPGAYRGYNYKPHGGMRLLDQNSGKIDVTMPTDATLVGLKRYYEGNPAELQYLLTFETDCGIAFRFDHMYTLAPAFQAIAQTTPEPKINDTRSDPNIPFTRTKFKTGELIATEVGFPRIKNFGFDFGVYDYRQRNEISKNKKWAALHATYQSSEWYGTCWLDQLPNQDTAKAKELAFTVINPAKPNIISDYCTDAPNTTLDFNNGKPTDG